MHRNLKMKVRELNPHVLCVLCGGYLVDATTIVECLHSFCRTCIVHYLHTSNYCPVCECLVHKKNPQLNIRSDRVLQDIVYKIVPGLFKEEMIRRREYYQVKDSVCLTNGRNSVYKPTDRVIYSPDERISLCLEFCPRGRPNDDNEIILKKQLQDKRFLLCPATTTIHHLKKFLRLKFSLSDRLEIEVFKTEEILFDDYTLVDIAYITEWKRENVLKLNYAIYENSAKRQKREKSPVAVSPGNEDSGIEDENMSHETVAQETEVNETSVKDMSKNGSADSEVKENISECNGINDSVVQTSPYTADDLDTDDLWNDEVVIDLSKPKQRNPDYVMDDSEYTQDSNMTEDGEQNYTYMVDGFSEGDNIADDGCIQIEGNATDSETSEKTGKGENSSSTEFVTSTQNGGISQTLTNSINLTQNSKGSHLKINVTEGQTEKESPCKKRKNSEGHFHAKHSNDSGAKSPKCTEVCNGHSVKPRNEKLVVKLSKERDSENYTATMS